jgi:hypothetical protein
MVDSSVPARLDETRRKANLRLALILASLAAMFLVGFVIKIVLTGG